MTKHDAQKKVANMILVLDGGKKLWYMYLTRVKCFILRKK